MAFAHSVFSITPFSLPEWHIRGNATLIPAQLRTLPDTCNGYWADAGLLRDVAEADLRKFLPN